MPIDRNKLLPQARPAQPAAPDTGELLSNELRERLMSIAGVEGVGIGSGGSVLVYTRDSSVRSRLPTVIENHPIQVEVTGGVRTY